MTHLDLKAIKARSEVIARDDDSRTYFKVLHDALASAHDVPALVKEVEALRDMLEGADIELAMTLERLWQRSSGEQRKTISMNWPNWYLGALETGFYRKYYSATTLKPEQEAEHG